MEKGNGEGRNDRWFYIVVLSCLLICLGSLYIVKDAEQRCDNRYKSVVQSCMHVTDPDLYNGLEQINLSEYPDYMKEFT